jgi:hypothetical protein
MTDERRADERIRLWIETGPDAASTAFVERTLRPIPRMRQRRSWRITVDRLLAPAAPAAAAVVVLAVALLAGGALLGGRLPVGAPAPASPSHVPGSYRPTFELTIGEGSSARTYRSEPTASVATCDVTPGRPAYALYAGGDPFVNIDFLVGIGAEKAEGRSRVAAEITAEEYYVRFDPAILRGGDGPGRSEATVTISTEGPSTTFVVDATTPNGIDDSPIAVSLTLTCQP